MFFPQFPKNKNLVDLLKNNKKLVTNKLRSLQSLKTPELEPTILSIHYTIFKNYKLSLIFLTKDFQISAYVNWIVAIYFSIKLSTTTLNHIQ